MDRLLRFDDDGDPTVDPDPAAGSADPDPAPSEAWGQGALADGDDQGPLEGLDPQVLDEGDLAGPELGEGTWDVFWGRSLDVADGSDPFDASFGDGPFGDVPFGDLPAPGDGADDVDLDVDLADDPGAGEGEMGAGPV